MEEFDDDPENGEKSEFFKKKSRRAQFKSATQALSTPSRKTHPEELHRLAAESTPTPQAYITSQPAASPDAVSTEKVAQGWKSVYGSSTSSTQSSPKLSSIIKKQNAASRTKAMTPLQRLSASSASKELTTPTFKTPSRTSTPQKIMKSFDIASFISNEKENGVQPSNPTIRPLTESFKNHTESSQEEWPEFVDVDRFRSTPSSQSIGQQSDVRGIFSKYAFQG